MSDYDTLEKSVSSSKPVELYEFTSQMPDLYGSALSPVTVYRYTSAEEEIIFENGYHFKPTPIERSTLHRGSGEVTTIEMTVTLPTDHELAQLFSGPTAPTTPLSVKVYRAQRSNTYLNTVAFQGQVSSVSFKGKVCTLTCSSLEALLKQQVPKFVAQRQCPFQLYGSECAVDPSAFKFDSTITAVDGRVITVSGAAAFAGTDLTYFSEGVMIGPNKEREFIEEQHGDEMKMLAINSSFIVGLNVTLLAGCDRQVSTCKNRFSNQTRFGGIMLAAPVINPYVSGLS